MRCIPLHCVSVTVPLPTVVLFVFSRTRAEPLAGLPRSGPLAAALLWLSSTFRSCLLSPPCCHSCSPWHWSLRRASATRAAAASRRARRCGPPALSSAPGRRAAYTPATVLLSGRPEATASRLLRMVGASSRERGSDSAHSWRSRSRPGRSLALSVHVGPGQLSTASLWACRLVACAVMRMAQPTSWHNEPVEAHPGLPRLRSLRSRRVSPPSSQRPLPGPFQRRSSSLLSCSYWWQCGGWRRDGLFHGKRPVSRSSPLLLATRTPYMYDTCYARSKPEACWGCRSRRAAVVQSSSRCACGTLASTGLSSTATATVPEE